MQIQASNELTHILEKIDHSKADIDVEVAAVQQENKEFKDIISQFT